MSLDRLELVAADCVSWPGGGGFPIKVLVNGIELIEHVRRVELPFAEAEYDRRYFAGDRGFGQRGARAGAYLYLATTAAVKYLLGATYDSGFGAMTKSLLLQCTCGITDCRFLLATIRIASDRVTWTDFKQSHRDWRYDLAFAFEREAYEAELKRVVA